jgi:hypothetical protein
MYDIPFNRLTKIALAASVALLGISQSAKAGNTWTGGGGSTNWSDNNNWGGSTPGYGTLTFTTGGTQGTTSSDDSITAQNKLFWTGSSSWVLNQGGSTVLSLYDNGGTQPKVENQSTGGVQINLPITFAANNSSPPNPWGEINAVNGDITFGTGTLTVNGSSVNGIKMYGAGHNTTFNDTVSASGKYFGMTAAGDIMNIGGSFTSGDIYLMDGGTLNLNSGGSITTSALRLGGDFGTTGNQNLGAGGNFVFTVASGGQSFGGTINPVSGNTSGALDLTADNTSGTDTLSGGFFLDSNLGTVSTSGGTLQLGSSGSTNTISFQSASSRVLTLGGAGNTTVNEAATNVANGSDQYTIAGGGIVTIAADNSASGANLLLFNNVSGTLAISSANNLGSPTISGSGYPDKVLFGAATGTNTASLLINGTFSYGSTTTGSILGFGINKTSASTGNTAIINVSGSNVFTMNGAISDNGSTGNVGSLQKSGTGTLVLAASNTYGGTTTINTGTLAVTNSRSLNSGNVTNNATLDIGNGTALNLNLGSGTYTQGTGSTLTLQVNSSSSYSSLQNTGAVSLGGTLNLNVSGTPTANGTKFTVLNTGTRSGVFSGYTTNLTSGAFDTSSLEKTGQLSVVPYFNGFENVNGTWANNASTFNNSVNAYLFGGSITPGSATQVVNAASASSNAAYGKLVPTPESISLGGPFPATANVGPLTRFGGNSASFGTGFTTQADVYIDPTWAGDSNGTGFDYSSAVSDSSGNYLRDFILHVFKSGSTLYATADSNSDYKPDANYVGYANKVAISSAGWYTVQDTFRNDGTGNLAVDIKLFNSAGSLLFQQTQNAGDALTGVGGNNYGWFVNIDTGTGSGNYLNADNVKLLTNTGSGLAGPAAVTAGVQLLADNPVLSPADSTFVINGTDPGAVTDGYDYLNTIHGTADLSGDLSVSVTPDFASQITPADTFTILQAPSITGSYDNIGSDGRVTTADGSGSFLATFSSSNGTESLTLSDFQSVPEPGMMPVIIAVGTGLLGRRARRR